MDNSFWAAAWYRWHCTLRRRLGNYLSIVLLLGLIGGLAMGAMVAARRTQSAYPTYLATSQVSDLEFTPRGDSFTVADQSYSPAFERKLARLPGVRRVAAELTVFAAPVTPAGKPYLPAAFANNEVDFVGPVGGLFYRQDRLVADQGHVPDPARDNEFALSARAAQLLHWHVGQVVPMAIYTLKAVFASTAALPQKWLLRIPAKLVGIVASSDSVANDEVDAYPVEGFFSPGLTNRLVAAGAAGFPEYYLQVDDGPQGVSAVERELVATLPRSNTYSFRVTSVTEGQVERAAEPESIALGAFGAIAALAVVIIVGQALARGIRANALDTYVLRALGAGPAVTASDSLLGTIGAVIGGALMATFVCVALTPVAPLGVVREIDASPGLDFDWAVLGLGAAFFVVSLGTFAAVLAWRTSPQRWAWQQSLAAPARPSYIVRTALRVGLPPSSVAGIRFAIERGRGRESVPVGSALCGAVLAVAVMATTFTFASGLSTLISHPALYGWNWSYAIEEAGGGNVPPVAFRLLGRDKYAAAWSGYSFANVEIDGQTVPVLLEGVGAAVHPPVLTGHIIEQANQIVMGGLTLAQLHKHVGDTVVVSYGARKDFPIYVPPTRLRIVGTATLPSIGNPGTLHVSMGTGALVPSEVEPAVMAKALKNPDPNQDGPAIVAIQLKRGVSAAAALASVQSIANAASRVVDRDPASGGGTFVVLPVQQPAEIVNYRTMGDTPAILAGGLAIGAVVALGLTLVASVRRRRKDLALLKTLGFVKNQLSAVVSWQASVAAAVGVVFGVPAGVVIGQTLWRIFAEKINAVPQPTVPVLEITLTCVVALALANFVAYVPGRIAARTPTASLLRAE